MSLPTTGSGWKDNSEFPSLTIRQRTYPTSTIIRVQFSIQHPHETFGMAAWACSSPRGKAKTMVLVPVKGPWQRGKRRSGHMWKDWSTWEGLVVQQPTSLRTGAVSRPEVPAAGAVSRPEVPAAVDSVECVFYERGCAGAAEHSRGCACLRQPLWP